jgi:hypothetical protein
MFNHDNGKYNIQHKYNPYTSSVKETGYGVVASQKINAGDEIYNSYNRCTVCDAWYDWFGTPEVFLQFGFVENYPQRWLFDLARVKFDLVREEHGKVGIKFLVPPSKRGVQLLNAQLSRLNIFSDKYRSKSKEEVGLRKLEWDSLWQYFDALHAALTYVTGTNETLLVDDVWELDDSWWVQEGTTEADTDEHYVRVSSRDSDEL